MWQSKLEMIFLICCLPVRNGNKEGWRRIDVVKGRTWDDFKQIIDEQVWLLGATWVVNIGCIYIYIWIIILLYSLLIIINIYYITLHNDLARIRLNARCTTSSPSSRALLPSVQSQRSCTEDVGQRVAAFPLRGPMRLNRLQRKKGVLVPSGKHTKNYGKSPFLVGKSTINGNFQ